MDLPILHSGVVDFSGRGPTVVRVATGDTNEGGRVTFKVPYLLDDPYFTKSQFYKTGFKLNLPNWPVGDWGRHWASDFVPRFVPVSRKYTQDFSVQLVQRRRLTANVGQSFAAKNEIELPSKKGQYLSYPLMLFASNKARSMGLGAMVQPSGGFSFVLSAGVYDLRTEYRDKGGPQLTKPISAANNVVVGEKAEVVVNLE